MKTLISKAQVMTIWDQTLAQKSIGIVDDMIAFVGEVPEDFKADKIIEGSGYLVMPGLVNAHTHSAMSLLRNYADDIPFWEWLTEKVWPVENQMGASEVYWGSMLSIAEMIRSGVTAFADMYFLSEETAKAAAQSGIRASIAKGLVGSSENDTERLSDTRMLVKNWHQAENGLITVMAGPHAPYTCDDAFLRKVANLCDDLQIPIHIHLSESVKEVEDSLSKHGRTPIQHMDDLGIFRHHTLAAHCVHLHPADFEILNDKQVNVVHNPASNLKLGNGIAPLSQLLEAGIPVSLGTDGSSSNNNLNLFEEMNLAALLAKGSTCEPTAAPAWTVLKMATTQGAQALNLQQKIGDLKPGMKADMILIDLNKPHLYPRLNLEASMVYSAQASDVDTVIINGKIIMEKKEMKTLDLERIYFEINQITKSLLGKPIDPSHNNAPL
ncbi:amidohydrolase [Anoxynatronum sibiricum]|uniref:5-methylthioadenosine/S-adenosylhomocysteine deaminase n=1 Tax=Anoxynatronum sibiricum TaxID=210623 RepID=A0ABU9VV17_9CLOT